jgi:hypothetical protein
MGPRAFNLAFCGLVALGIASATALVVGFENRLPPPPFTATRCIDDKFRFLHERDLAGVNLVAVGSSVTLHNLDLAVLSERVPGVVPLNASPCHLHVDQTAYMVRFLLDHMPEVNTVLTVMSPRDFKRCSPNDTAFFDDDLAGWYIFGKQTAAPVYLQALGSSRFLQALFAGATGRPKWDPYGTHPMHAKRKTDIPLAWDPEPACFAALGELERLAESRGARLVVATFPTMPSWAKTYDPDGRTMAAWHAALRATLRSPRTVLVDGSELHFADDAFADPLHLLWSHTDELTEHIAKSLDDEQLVALKQR